MTMRGRTYNGEKHNISSLYCGAGLLIYAVADK